MTIRGYKQSPEHIEARRQKLLGREQTAEQNALRVRNRRINNGGRYTPKARARNTTEILWSKVDRRGPDECWIWRGTKPGRNGYARTEVAGKRYLVHRVFFDLANPGLISLKGSGPGGSDLILHSCDTPLCCNPRHLRIGTPKENADDRTDRGRQAQWGPDGHPRCKLTVAQANEIRRLRQEGMSGRAVAKMFGISPQTVSSINRGRYYK